MNKQKVKEKIIGKNIETHVSIFVNGLIWSRKKAELKSVKISNISKRIPFKIINFPTIPKVTT